jgi:hydroxymethylpyrimidine pyrophosphatase-like HAD family hydrolase
MSARASVLDLHLDIRELAVLSRDAARRGEALDTYLACCGMAQIIEDWREATDSPARRLTALLGEGGPGHRALRHGVNAANAVVRAAALAGAAQQLRGEVGELVTMLADILAAERRQPADTLPRPALDLAERVATTAAGRLPGALTAAVARPPSCFRSFDQHPQDCAELAWRFALEYDARDTPVVVLGVRTSGAYLAPLIAAALRATGFRRAEAATARPGGLLPHAALRRAGRRCPGRARGLVAVVDDPPTTGGSMAQVARSVRRTFPASRVIALYAAFDGPQPPKLPADMPRIVLPANAWHIRRLLDQSSVEALVRAAFPFGDVTDVIVEEPGLPTRDGHLGVLVTARFRTQDGGSRETAMRAEAAGLGYFGGHAREVAARLDGLVPPVHALHDGVLLRGRGEPIAAEDVPVAEVAAYVAARRQRLRVPSDRSSGLDGRQPAWEVGARILAAGFGRAAPALRPLVVDPLLRKLLTAAEPCITDGRTALSTWESIGEYTEDGARKSDFDEGSFSHLDLACYDAAFDLAGAAVLRPESRSALHEAYTTVTGTTPDRARWFVYEYLQAWNMERVRDDVRAAHEAQQARSRAVQQFFADVFLADLVTEPTGPFVVLDVDGVLELDFGGTPATTLAAMRALRALRAHGYRVVLATGRSLPEVSDRCTAYLLAGAVAEYGAAAYVTATGETVSLPEATVPGHARTALANTLLDRPNLTLDHRYRWCLRVSEHRPDSSPRGMRGLALSRITAAHTGFVPVIGDAQTDFVPAGVEKSAGVRALMKLLGAADAPVALAVGDTSMDLGILRMADLGLAPAHASSAVRAAGVRRTRAAYQAGLAEAVARLLGHRPGACAECAMPQLGRADRLVATLLSAGERGPRGLAPAAARLAVQRLKGGAPWM